MYARCTCVGDEEKHADQSQGAWPKQDLRETPHIENTRTEDAKVSFRCIVSYAIVAAHIYLHLVPRSPHDPRSKIVRGTA